MSSRITDVVAPLLARAGLDVRAVSGADGQVRELIITNPRRPEWGRVVIDCDGLMQWHYWGHIADDPGAASTADVIIAIMARPGNDAAGYAQASHPAARQQPGGHEPRETGHDAGSYSR